MKAIITVLFCFVSLSYLTAQNLIDITFSTSKVVDTLGITSNTSAPLTATIYNVLGKSVQSIEIEGNSVIDCSTLKAGIYRIYITSSTTDLETPIKYDFTKYDRTADGELIEQADKPECMTCAMKQSFMSNTRLARR